MTFFLIILIHHTTTLLLHTTLNICLFLPEQGLKLFTGQPACKLKSCEAQSEPKIIELNNYYDFLANYYDF